MCRTSSSCWSCQCHCAGCPKSTFFHLPSTTRQKQSPCRKSAAPRGVDLGLWSCHRHISESLPSATIAAKASCMLAIWWKFLSCAGTFVLAPPWSGRPHDTTVSSCKIAAKAGSAPKMCRRKWSWTLELSPPKLAMPHVTTVPSARIAAKPPAATNLLDVLELTLDLSPPCARLPQVTRDPSARMAAKSKS